MLYTDSSYKELPVIVLVPISSLSADFIVIEKYKIC